MTKNEELIKKGRHITLQKIRIINIGGTSEVETFKTPFWIDIRWWIPITVCRCFTKYVFLKTLQYSQENTCVVVSFNKVAGLKACSFIKKRLQRSCFPVNIAKCLRTGFYRTPLVATDPTHEYKERERQTERLTVVLTESVVPKRSVKMLFLRISKNSLENTCASDFFK